MSGRATLLALSAANVVLSAGLQLLPLAFFGAGVTVDIFIASMIVPSVVTAVAAVVVTYVLVPPLATAGPEQERSLIRHALLAATRYLALPMLVLVATAAYWVPWSVPGFSVAAVEQTVSLARVSVFAAIVGSYALVLSAQLQARSHFISNAAAATSSTALAAVFAAIALPHLGIVAAAYSLIFRSAAQFALLWLVTPTWRGARSDRDLVLEKRAMPLLLSASVSKLEPVVDRSLLSSAPPGVLTVYFVAQQIYGACSQVVASAFLVHVLPELSRLHADARRARMWRMLKRESRRLAALGIAIAVLIVGSLLLLQASPLAAVVAEKLDLTDLAKLLIALSGVWLFGLQGNVLAAFYYARGDTTTPAAIAIGGFAFALVFKIVGYREGGALGLSLGNSLYYFCTAAGMFLWIRRSARVDNEAHGSQRDRS